MSEIYIYLLYMANKFSRNMFEPIDDIDISNTSISLETPLEVSSESSSFDFFKYFRYLLIFIIILFLAFATYNTLTGNDITLGYVLDKILRFVGVSAGEITKQTVDVSTKGLVDVAESIQKGTDSAINKLEARIDNKATKKPKVRTSDNSMVDKAIGHAQKNSNIPVADESSSSSINRERGQAGYCFVGEQKGIRSCIKVGENDQCMSGDIFPTQDICINPNLRLGGSRNDDKNSKNKNLPRVPPVGSLLAKPYDYLSNSSVNSLSNVNNNESIENLQSQVIDNNSSLKYN